VGEAFVLTLWTNDVSLARRAVAAGIDRIGVDLETLGKAERQSGFGTWISPHHREDITQLRPVVPSGGLFARVNPFGPGTAAEVSALLRGGVDVIMLPMFRSAAEVADFCAVVDGRAAIVLLLETREALDDLDRILLVPGITEVHVGINDLSLSLGLANRFAVYLHPAVERAARTVLEVGARFGIGGIGRVGDDRLPVPADLIYAQYPRLGATGALIARAFVTPARSGLDLTAEVARARARLAAWAACSGESLDEARVRLEKALTQVDRW
jgi:hypothetical protein